MRFVRLKLNLIRLQHEPVNSYFFKRPLRTKLRGGYPNDPRLVYNLRIIYTRVSK